MPPSVASLALFRAQRDTCLLMAEEGEKPASRAITDGVRSWDASLGGTWHLRCPVNVTLSRQKEEDSVSSDWKPHVGFPMGTRQEKNEADAARGARRGPRWREMGSRGAGRP